MIKFLTELTLTNDNDPYKRVVSPFIVQVNDTVVSVPAGFRTNLASTPKWLHWLLPPDDPHYIRASVVHDWLYAKAIVPRNEADKIFRLLAQHDGTSTEVAWTMFTFIRIFGSSHYNRKRFK